MFDPGSLEMTLKIFQPPSDISRQQLRQILRARRRALTVGQQVRAALGLVNRIGHQHVFRNARHIAFYIANDGELDPEPLIRRALALGKHCYLPVLDTRSSAMAFARYRPGDKLWRNRFGIPEPIPRVPRVAGDELDLVCLPLVGFDLQGNRLGMGGGFYDRTFSYRRHYRKAAPVLVGLAHQCQQVSTLGAQSWDVPVDMIITGTACHTIAG
jgi:5-formyltetrahydrofolate cyclo-ligase